ncbi:MAG: hypothetical protein U0Q21_02055 [Dermatophilaceae bacterium]
MDSRHRRAVLLLLWMPALAGCSDSDSNSGRPSTSAVSSPTTGAADEFSSFDESDAKVISEALSSADPAAFDSVLDPSLRDALRASTKPGLAAGAKVTLDASRLGAVRNQDRLEVPATVSGDRQNAGPWTVIVIREPDGWRVIGAVRR